VRARRLGDWQVDRQTGGWVNRWASRWVKYVGYKVPKAAINERREGKVKKVVGQTVVKGLGIV